VRAGERRFALPTRDECQGCRPHIHVSTHDRSQQPVRCDETRSTILEGIPVGSGSLLRGQKGPQLREPRFGQPERGVPYVNLRCVQGQSFASAAPINQLFR
jgi:hypothetical protein